MKIHMLVHILIPSICCVICPTYYHFRIRKENINKIAVKIPLQTQTLHKFQNSGAGCTKPISKLKRWIGQNLITLLHFL